MNYILSHAFVFIVIAAVLALPGLLWDALFFGARSGPLRPLAVAVTGASTWMILAFGLCVVHGYRRSAVLVVVAILLLGVVLAWRHRRQSPRVPMPADTSSRLIIAVPVVLLFVALFLISLQPRMSQDAEAYHLAVPRDFAAVGGFKRIPFNVYSNWPLFGELLYGFILLFDNFVSATGLHLVFGVLVTLALMWGCRSAALPYARWAGWLAAAFFWMNPLIQLEGSAAYVELMTTFFFVAGFLFMYQATVSAEDRGLNLLLGGIAAGILAGTKVNGAAGSACIAAPYLFRSVRDRLPLGLWARSFLLPAALLAIVWPIKSWVLTGNPLYPFFYSVWGGPEWSDRLTVLFTDWQHSIGMGRSLTDYLLLPVRVFLMGGPGYDQFAGFLSAAWVGIVPLTLVLGWRQRFVRLTLETAALYFVLWSLASQQSRFLIPCLALLALAAAVAVAEAVSRFVAQPQRVALPFLSVAASALLVTNSVTTFGDARDWFHVYLGHGATFPQSNIPPLFDFINTQLPENARILLMSTNRSYFIHRDVIADSFYEASQISDWVGSTASADEVHHRLRAAGVTHVFVQEHLATITYPPGLEQLVSQRKGIRLIWHDPRNGQWLYSLCETLTCPGA